jgi:hypothetical protein
MTVFRFTFCLTAILMLGLAEGQSAVVGYVNAGATTLQEDPEQVTVVPEEKIAQTTSVGQIGRLEQIVFPGPLLEAVPFDPDAEVVLRIAQTYPHGSAWRYDFEYRAQEPGIYNLVEYLRRIDGSSTEALTPIYVKVESVLPPGQIVPNELENKDLPWLGGYQMLAIVGVIVWMIVMLMIIFGWRKKSPEEIAREKPKTLADYLRPRITAAKNGELDSKGFAELERMLTAYWKQQLHLEDHSAIETMQRIKADEQAGPIFKKIEIWLHSPDADQSTSVNELLAPYEHVELSEIKHTQSEPEVVV